MFGNILVWYHPEGVANILFLKTLKEKYHVTYDSYSDRGALKVETPGRVVTFKPHENGFHYLDMNVSDHQAITVVIVRDNFEGVTKNEIEGAIKAYDIQALLGYPSRKDFKNIMHAQLIANCPITQNYIANAYAIFGDNLAGI